MPVIMPANMLNIHLDTSLSHMPRSAIMVINPESWPPKSSQWTAEDCQSVSANKNIEKPGPWTPGSLLKFL